MKNYTKEIHSKRFTAKAEEKLHFLLEPIFSAIESLPSEKFKNGFKIQAAFSVFVLDEKEDGFDILVHDYKNGLKLTDDLTGALLIQYEQSMMLRMCGLSGETVRYDDVVAVSKGALEQKDICMQRFSDLEGSGWCINETGKDEDGNFYIRYGEEYETVYAYQLLQLRYELIKVLLMPCGSTVVFSGNEIADILGENGMSLLDEGGIVQ